jgi:hypothetical protein
MSAVITVLKLLGMRGQDGLKFEHSKNLSQELLFEESWMLTHTYARLGYSYYL